MAALIQNRVTSAFLNNQIPRPA